jgi:hypothetical protein
LEEDKGKRLISASTGWVRNSCKFAWNTDNAKEWRRKLALFAEFCGCASLEELAERFGSRWAYRLQGAVVSIEDIITYSYNHPGVIRVGEGCR